MTSVLEKNNINVLLFSGSNNNLNSVVDFVDGFICYGRPRNHALVEQLKTTPKHVVTVDFDINRNASVNINNEQASYEIAKHVLHNINDKPVVKGLIELIKIRNEHPAFSGEFSAQGEGSMCCLTWQLGEQSISLSVDFEARTALITQVNGEEETSISLDSLL